MKNINNLKFLFQFLEEWNLAIKYILIDSLKRWRRHLQMKPRRQMDLLLKGSVQSAVMIICHMLLYSCALLMKARRSFIPVQNASKQYLCLLYNLKRCKVSQIMKSKKGELVALLVRATLLRLCHADCPGLEPRSDHKLLSIYFTQRTVSVCSRILFISSPHGP